MGCLCLYCKNKKFRMINMKEHPIAINNIIIYIKYMFFPVDFKNLFLIKNKLYQWIFISDIKSLSIGSEIKLFWGFGLGFSPINCCFVVLIVQGLLQKRRSAIKSNILKKLCNGNVEQLDITGRGKPVIILSNHVFRGKFDHRTMNDE